LSISIGAGLGLSRLPIRMAADCGGSGALERWVTGAC
jgi:hypothetical protein